MFVVLLAGVVVFSVWASRFALHAMAYSDFRNAVGQGKVAEVTIAPHWIRARIDGVEHEVVRVDDPDLYETLVARQVKVTPPTSTQVLRVSWL